MSCLDVQRLYEDIHGAAWLLTTSSATDRRAASELLNDVLLELTRAGAPGEHPGFDVPDEVKVEFYETIIDRARMRAVDISARWRERSADWRELQAVCS